MQNEKDNNALKEEATQNNIYHIYHMSVMIKYTTVYVFFLLQSITLFPDIYRYVRDLVGHNVICV